MPDMSDPENMTPPEFNRKPVSTSVHPESVFAGNVRERGISGAIGGKEAESRTSFIQVNSDIMRFGRMLDSGQYNDPIDKNALERQHREKVEERQKMYQEIKDMGIVDRVRRRISSKLKEASSDPSDAWDSAIEGVEGIADDLEQEALNSQTYGYAERTYLHGIVKAMVLGAAKDISLRGYQKIEDDEANLRRHGTTKNGVERLKKEVAREHFLEWHYDPYQELNENIVKRRQVLEREARAGYTPAQQELDSMNAARGRQPLQQEMLRTLTSIDSRMGSFEQVAVNQANMSAEYNRVLDPESMRRLWIDVVYSVDFYARFQPGQEPSFYTLYAAKNENDKRYLQSIAWEVARAAYIKKRLANLPDKYVENEELNDLTKENFERLVEEIPGVHIMLEAYVDAFYKEFTTDRPNGGRGRMSFWDITSAKELEHFRNQMRNERLFNDRQFVDKFPELQIRDGDSEATIAEKRYKLEYEAKWADSLARDLLQIGLTTESLDSRYSVSGERHDSLPGILLADEYRAALHPQEKWESKSLSQDPWGAFGFWGAEQVRQIKERFPRVKLKAGIANGLRQYWDTKPKGSDEREILFPEIYPVTTFKSFFEFATDKGGTDNRGVSILERLRRKEPIKWKEIAEDKWAMWNTGKFTKAVKALEAWKNPKPFDTRIKAWLLVWAKDLMTVTDVKLGMERELNQLRHEGKTFQKWHNIKLAPIYAAFGGVKDITRKVPDLNTDWTTRQVLKALGHNSVNYLSSGESLNFE